MQFADFIEGTHKSWKVNTLANVLLLNMKKSFVFLEKHYQFDVPIELAARAKRSEAAIVVLMNLYSETRDITRPLSQLRTKLKNLYHKGIVLGDTRSEVHQARDKVLEEATKGNTIHGKSIYQWLENVSAVKDKRGRQSREAAMAADAVLIRLDLMKKER